MRRRPPAWALAAILALAPGCAGVDTAPALTVSGSAVGREAELLRTQLVRFEQTHPGVRARVRATPDAADDRRQLYVQWLNARTGDPDVLQLDVIWTAEFAAAGWILALDRFEPSAGDFFPAAIEAGRWNRTLYALPWFVDVGLLYWRTDLMGDPPATLDELAALATRAVASGQAPLGFVWQGARYEGLVTVFLEHLTAFGGRVLDATGAVALDDEAGVRALTFMRDAIHASGFVPAAVLAWREEPARFAFQNGQAAFMRNWPYARSLLADPAQSRVAGRFDVAPMPGAPGGSPAAALGGSQLAINAFSEHPEAAYELVRFLTAPEQMAERARVAGQLPARRGVYDQPAPGGDDATNAAAIRRIIDHAVARPSTPVYNELSEILQVHLHRALTLQETPRAALAAAAGQIRRLLEDTGLSPGAS